MVVQVKLRVPSTALAAPPNVSIHRWPSGYHTGDSITHTSAATRVLSCTTYAAAAMLTEANRSWRGTQYHRVLDAMQVKLSVPGTALAAPTMETFVAVGIGVLVSEDWASQGSVQLFRVAKERTQGFDGEFSAHWQLVDTHRREFTGPLTALSTSGGNLVVAYGHNVRSRST